MYITRYISTWTLYRIGVVTLEYGIPMLLDSCHSSELKGQFLGGPPRARGLESQERVHTTSTTSAMQCVGVFPTMCLGPKSRLLQASASPPTHIPVRTTFPTPPSQSSTAQTLIVPPPLPPSPPPHPTLAPIRPARRRLLLSTNYKQLTCLETIFTNVWTLLSCNRYWVPMHVIVPGVIYHVIFYILSCFGLDIYVFSSQHVCHFML